MGGEGDAEDEMVGWHHQLDGHEFEQAPGIGEGQGSLACCSPWGRRVSQTRLSDQEAALSYILWKNKRAMKDKRTLILVVTENLK